MKSHLVLLALVGLACASVRPAWKDNTEYVYLVNGRTFTSLHELSNQYSGVFLRARIYITTLADGNKLQARIPVAEYAQVHSQLPKGWNSYFPESELTYKQLDLSNKPFQIVMKDGLIKSLIVEKDMTNWEANIIKSIVSQFQLDIKGKNRIPSPMNNMPKEDRFDGVFKTMEETVTGEVETSYEIHRFPEYLIQNEPWLVPQPKLKGDGQIIEIIKNKNYTNSNERPAYHYGFGDLLEGHPTDNQIGKFYTRQSNSRVILTGKYSRFTIQSSRTINKIIVNPTLNAKEQGSVVSIVNVTLHEVRTQSDLSQELRNPITIGNLVYTFDSGFAESNKVHKKQEERSDSESSSEEDEESWKRIRRSSGPILRKLQESENYDSSSAEMDQYQRRPVMSEPPEFPFLPYNMGYKGQSIKSNNEFDLKQNVKRIAKEISEDVQQPEKILNHSTLSKYIMLCSLTRLMNEEEIRTTGEELYTSSEKGPERITWVAFRDAVAETGTGPGLLNIQQWIESKKIENLEASEIVAALANAVRVPTDEFMRKFFELSKKSQVRSQQNLNETVIMVYCELVNKVYVNRNKSNNEYPVHSFGDLYSKKGFEFVNSTVIPYLTQKLHNAVYEADSRKIHVYIRALGNIGHRQILKAFEPYLEGNKQVSQFQRMLMVLSLDNLVMSDPVVARSVLYKIYQNIAEVPEVRVVAVYQLMRTNPPVEMVQRMAENTNTDPQEEVNAAVKYVIKAASQLKSEDNRNLRKAAKAAEPLLTKNEYGQHQSLNLLQDFVVENMDIEFHHNLLQVGSTDYGLPKGIKYGVRENINGIRSQVLNVQTTISSIKELLNVFYKHTQHYQQSYQKFQTPGVVAGQTGENHWSSEKIAELLNLQTDEREQLEGFIYTQMGHMHQLWSINNESMARIPQEMREQEEMWKNGKEFSYAKLRQVKEMELSFPIEMGLPFLYTYNQPIFVQFEGKISAVATPLISRGNKLHVPDQIRTIVTGFVTYSSKVQSHLSVPTPFDHQIYIAGFEKTVQAHLPMKAKVQIDVKNQQAEIEYEVKESHKNAKLLHYSSWPYTSKNDIMSLSPVALSPTTYLIKPQGHRSFDFAMGQKETGMSFRVWGHHSQQLENLLQLVKIFQTGDISTLWQKVWDAASLDQTELNIALIPDQTSTKKVVLRLGHQGKYQKQPDYQNEREQCSVEKLSSKLEQEPLQRQQDLLKCVGAQIQSAKLHSFDASLEFQGSQKYEHLFTLAFAKSNVAPLSRLVAFYKIKSQEPVEMAIEMKGSIPNINELDYTYSLKNEPKAKYDVLFYQKQWDQGSSKVKAIFDLSRSEKRKTYLKSQPLYEVCKRQMQAGNYHLSACRNMTTESNYLDQIKIHLEYENIRKQWSNYIESIFKGIRLFYYPVTEIKSIQTESRNKITLDVQFQPKDLRKVNITVLAHNEETKMFNLSLSETTKTILVPHPVYHLQARILGQIMQQKNSRPTCVIDKKAAETFSNLTYQHSLGKEWSLMMQYIPEVARPRGEGRQPPVEQLRNQNENFAALVRELSPEQKEIKMVFTFPQTEDKTVEVTMKSRQQGSMPLASVLVDGKEVMFSDKQAAELFNGFVEIYALPNGEVKMEIKDWCYIIFDGDRVKLTATSDKFRDSVVGLCGRLSGDRYEDFWTPKNCIVRSAEKFVNSFVVGGKLQYQEQSQQQYQDCIPKVLPLYSDVVSDYDVQRKGQEYDDESSTGIKLRSRYVEENGDICFTIHPVPVCENIARDSITKDVPVHCITKTKTAYYLKNQIDQGGNPDFSNKSETKTIQMELPKYCY